MNDRRVKVAGVIAEHVAMFIVQEANTDPMITVTRVEVSADFHNATVFITTIPDGREADAIIFLRRRGALMRRFVMKKLSMKIIPRLDFSVDYGERHRQHIDEIVREQGIESTFPEKDAK